MASHGILFCFVFVVFFGLWFCVNYLKWNLSGRTRTDVGRKTHKHNDAAMYFSFSLKKTHFAEDLRHLERSRGVHVGSDDGDAGVGLFGVAECEGPLKVHLRGTRHHSFLDMNFNHSPWRVWWDGGVAFFVTADLLWKWVHVAHVLGLCGPCGAHWII